MARNLLNDQGYDTQKMQVLLGGWGLWKEKHDADPNIYQTVPNALPTPAPVQQIQPALPPTATISK